MTDPLSLNRYAYTKNSPLNYWDPSGHASEGKVYPPYVTGEDPQYDYIPDYPSAGGSGRENWNGEIPEGELSNLIEMIREAGRQGKLYIDYCGDFSEGVQARDFERTELERIQTNAIFGLKTEWTESSLERYVREAREKAKNQEWFDKGYASSDTLYVLTVIQVLSGLAGGSQSGGYSGNQSSVIVTPDGSIIIGAEINAGALAGIAGLPWMQGKAEGESEAEKTVTNSAGQEVTRKYVKDQDELLKMAEEAAGGNLDDFTEIKPGWYQNKEGTIKIEWNPEGHANTNEGPHVTVRHKNEKGGWSVVEKYFIEGRDNYK